MKEKTFTNIPDGEDGKNISFARTITMQYEKHSYVMVLGKQLSFAKAEQFCKREFAAPMHLASISNANEWKVVSDTFRSENTTEIWLGGEVTRHPAGPYFGLTWLDHTKFSYHRISKFEQTNWLQKLLVGKFACLVGDLEQSGNGNWTLNYAPCEEKLAFVCKGPIHHRSSMLHGGGLSSFLTLPTKKLINQMSILGFLDPYSLQDLKNKAATERSILFEERVFKGNSDELLKTKPGKTIITDEVTQNHKLGGNRLKMNTELRPNKNSILASYLEEEKPNTVKPVIKTTDMSKKFPDDKIESTTESSILTNNLVPNTTEIVNDSKSMVSSLLNEASLHSEQIPSLDESISFDDIFGFDEPSDEAINWF